MRECGIDEWAKFRRYHYLNTDLAKSCRCFGLYDDNKIIGFAGVLHQPHARWKNLKRISRLVILPDYQGIGLGCKFLNLLGDYYAKQNCQLSIVTSAKNLVCKLSRSEKWRMIRLSANKCGKGEIDRNRGSIRSKCKTASFFYIKTEQNT